MTPFSEHYARAVQRKGAEELAARFPLVCTPNELAAQSDSRWLASMAQRVFSAGFVWRVIQAKWEGFEQAFDGFDPATVAHFDAERLGALGQDARIVRNGQKILATVQNAQFVQAVAEEHGSFGAWVAGWPDDDIVGLWAQLKTRGSRLGGDSGPRLLRGMGKDTFVLTQDVIAALVLDNIVPRKPTSQTALRAVQDAFNTWRSESGLSFGAISITLACTVDSARSH